MRASRHSAGRWMLARTLGVAEPQSWFCNILCIGGLVALAALGAWWNW